MIRLTISVRLFRNERNRSIFCHCFVKYLAMQHQWYHVVTRTWNSSKNLF